MFRDKTKRTAHPPRHDPKTLEQLRKRQKAAATVLNQRPSPRPIASGVVSVGTILDNSRFLRLVESEANLTRSSSGENSSDSSSFQTSRNLRTRNPSFTYNEYFLIDRYRSEAYYCELDQISRKPLRRLSEPRINRKIIVSRTWNDAPTDYHTKKRESGRALQWDRFLLDGANLSLIAPVQCFKQAPLYNIWAEIAVPGTFVEFRNPFLEGSSGHWFGAILYFAGYLALVKLECFSAGPEERSYLAWISFCSPEPKPLGWCYAHGLKLELGEIRPENLSRKKLEKKLEEFYSQPRRSLTSDHLARIAQDIYRPTGFNPAVPVEVLDVERLSGTRLGKISAQIYNFVHVVLYEDCEEQKGFWLNLNSGLVHPFGWSNAVGVELRGVPESICPDYVLQDGFFENMGICSGVEILEGMRLEMRHPILIFKFVGAVVVEVLKFGHFIVQTLEKCEGTRVKFLVHFNCPLIFPWGWALERNVSVDCCRTDWDLPDLRLDLRPERASHTFEEGMKLEALDPLNSWFVVPATVQKIAGHMLLIHIDRTEFTEVNMFWVDAEFGDIFPAGFAEMVGFRFRGCV